ncbi:MAG: TadE/TadG family type IV pilus assembly protein [Pirellulales bacterium]
MSSNPRKRKSRRYGRRRGVVVVESAIVSSVLLVILLTILDLGVTVARYNALSAAARAVARAAIVRGSESWPEMSPWGPVSFDGSAADTSEIAAMVSHSIPAIAPQDVLVDVDWIDGGNEQGRRVRVRLGYVHVPLSILGIGGGLNLARKAP